MYKLGILNYRIFQYKQKIVSKNFQMQIFFSLYLQKSEFKYCEYEVSTD